MKHPKLKRKRKKPVARTPIAVEKYKKLFIEQLATGKTPAVAARLVNIARITAYVWRKNDEVFAADWLEAIEAGLDEVENRVYQNALDGNSGDAHFILRSRRREIYGNVEQPRSNFVLNITLEDQFKRLERLGIPLPMIESDAEEVPMLVESDSEDGDAPAGS